MENQTKQTNNSKLIYTLLILALIGSWAYIFYLKNQTKETVTLLETKIVNVDSARIAIQQEFTMVSAKADSLSSANNQLQGELADKNNAIQSLKSNISSILKKKNATSKELQQAKKMIGELNGKIDGLFTEIEKLKGENQVLSASNTQLSTEKQNLQDNLSTTQNQKKELEEKVDVASTLHASNIGIGAIQVSNSGKEKETNTAKKTAIIRLVFNIDNNRVTPSGPKEIFVVVIGPDGKTMSESGSFETREDGTKKFSNKLTLNYEQGKNNPVSFDLKNPSQFKEGNYKIEIYNNGFKIGEGTKTLKKGGLF